VAMKEELDGRALCDAMHAAGLNLRFMGQGAAHRLQ